MGAFAKRNWTPASILIVSKLVSSYGAGGRTRTGTPSLAVDFESTTSTNSITPALPGYYTAGGGK